MLMLCWVVCSVDEASALSDARQMEMNGIRTRCAASSPLLPPHECLATRPNAACPALNEPSEPATNHPAPLSPTLHLRPVLSKPAGYFSQTPMSPTAPAPAAGATPSSSLGTTQLAQGRRSHEMPTPKTRSRVGTPVNGARPKSGVKDAAVHAWLTKVEPDGP